MGTVTKIATKREGYSYRPLLKSEDINVVGAKWGLGSIAVVPAGEVGRIEHGGPEIAGPWAFVTTAPMVIDNYGGSAREKARAIQIELGSEVEVEGLPGVYTIEQRDQMKLEGDGVKLVPADDAARANAARLKVESELAWLWLQSSNEAVSDAKYRLDRAAAAIEEFEAAGGVSSLFRQALAGARAMAIEAGKRV